MTNQALGRAIDALGSQQKLADAIGARQSHISYWYTTAKTGVPAEWCAAIETATGISKHELRPDIFGPPAGQHVSGAAA